jgi:integrase
LGKNPKKVNLGSSAREGKIMGWVRKLAYTKPDGKGGRVQKRTRDWWIGWTDAGGVPQRKKIGRDKRAAEGALARLQELVARQRAGLEVESEDAARPLAELVAEYLAALSARGRDATYRATVDRQLTKALVSCRWAVWPQIRKHDLELYLGRIRDSGRSPATANNHLRSIRGFVRWLADRLGVADPLRAVKSLNEAVDRRRSRVLLSDPEFSRLRVAAEGAPRRHGSLVPGLARSVLYLVAAYSGLRASELASLTPGHFELMGKPPTVSPHPADAKGKREEPVALPAHLVPVLVAFFADKPADGSLWPGRWAEQKRQTAWLHRDLRRAGIGTTNSKGRQCGPDGRPYTFHSLRRKFVTGMIRAGVDIATVRKQARHRDVKTTLDYYAETNLTDQGDAANKLPPPS